VTRFILKIMSLTRDVRALSRGTYPHRLDRKSIIRRVNRHIR
jgi:hypothetical protein